MAITDNLVVRVQRQAGDSVPVNIPEAENFTGSGSASAITDGSDLGWRITGPLSVSWPGRSSIDVSADGNGITVALRYKINSNGDSGDYDQFFAIDGSGATANILTRSGSSNRARFANTQGSTTFSPQSVVKTVVFKAKVASSSSSDRNQVWIEGETHSGTDPDKESSGENYAPVSGLNVVNIGMGTTAEIDVYDLAIWDRELTDQECLDVAEDLRGQLPVGGSTAVSFSGTVPTQNLTVDEAMTPLDLSTYFSGTETPFSYAVQSGTLPTGLSLNSSTGVISGTPTATGTSSIVVRATDQTPDTADTNSFDIVVAAAGDVTAPTLSSPTGTQTGQTTADLSVSTDEDNGTLYWIVSESATPPSVAQIQAGNDSTGSAAADSGSQSVSATGTQNANATGLSAGTTYYAYFQHTDTADNDSTVAASSSFTTASLASVTVTDPLKNNTGTVLSNETGVVASVLDATTLESILEVTGLTTNGSGVLEAIENAAITASSSYHVAIKLSDGSVGITGPITAA